MILLSVANQESALPTERQMAKHLERPRRGRERCLFLCFDLAQVKAAHESPRLTLTCSSSPRIRGETFTANGHDTPEVYFGYQVSEAAFDTTPQHTKRSRYNRKAAQKTGRFRKMIRRKSKEKTRVVGKYTAQLLADFAASLEVRCFEGTMEKTRGQ